MYARKLIPAAMAAVVAGLVTMSVPAFAGPAAPSVPFTKLTLINGWNAYSGSPTPAVADVGGIITFKGAISSSSTNTNEMAFILPPEFRPAKYVNVPVDMCDATTGELNIAPTGVTDVISGSTQTDATCFTSLDGASFSLSTAGFTKLHLNPGWKNGSASGRNAGVRVSGGLVQLVGQIVATAKNPVPFTLPAGFRPAKAVYVPVTMCTGSIGRLYIKPSGVVTAQAVDGMTNFWEVKCGVSLEGASFALSANSFSPLTIKNGWTNGPHGTAKAGVRLSNGIVHFKGAIATTGSSAVPFFLPKAMRPAKELYITVDLCNANNGRLIILPTGAVSVEAEFDDFANAQCLTSLDGASFAR